MCELRCDPSFIEEAVFLELSRLAAAGDRRAGSAFHREREAVYELPDAQQRDAAFQRLAQRTFEALGLSEPFTARLAEFPLVPDRVELVMVRRVWTKPEEQVELYVGPSGAARPAQPLSTTLFIGLRAARCLERPALTAFLRHELMHVADMLDPAFAYNPHARLGADGAPEGELVRARFRALWDLWVHARMRRRGWPTALDGAARQGQATRAFAFLRPSDREALVAAVSRRDRWTHAELLALARPGAEAAAGQGPVLSEAAA
jgi:hypothetical protein